MGKGRRRAAGGLVATIVLAVAFWVLAGLGYANHNPCTGGTPPGPLVPLTGTGVYVKSGSSAAVCFDAFNLPGTIVAGFNVQTTISDPNSQGAGLMFTNTRVCTTDNVLGVGIPDWDPLCTNDFETLGQTGAEVGVLGGDVPGGGTFGTGVFAGGGTCVAADGIVIGSCPGPSSGEIVGVTVAENDVPHTHGSNDPNQCFIDLNGGASGCGGGGAFWVHMFGDGSRPTVQERDIGGSTNVGESGPSCLTAVGMACPSSVPSD